MMFFLIILYYNFKKGLIHPISKFKKTIRSWNYVYKNK
jgi:hypothetical protein